MRIVLDTNIYIAAVIHDGFSAHVIDILVKNREFTIIFSEEILNELEQKLKNKFNWPQIYIDPYLSKIRSIGEVVVIKEKVLVITRDPEDNKILECALSGNADLIVTMDQDLIKLKSFEDIAIIHPKTLSWTFPEYFKKLS